MATDSNKELSILDYVEPESQLILGVRIRVWKIRDDEGVLHVLTNLADATQILMQKNEKLQKIDVGLKASAGHMTYYPAKMYIGKNDLRSQNLLELNSVRRYYEEYRPTGSNKNKPRSRWMIVNANEELMEEVRSLLKRDPEVKLIDWTAYQREQQRKQKEGKRKAAVEKLADVLNKQDGDDEGEDVDAE